MKQKIKETLLPAFFESVTETFSTMVLMPLTVGEVEEIKPNEPKGDISGTIGLTGESACGSLSLVFSKSLGEKIFRSMMMDPNANVSETELRDVVGELANMVAGGAKARLKDQGTSFQIGLPTVISGQDHYLQSMGDASSFVVTMTVTDDKFYMLLSFSE